MCFFCNFTTYDRYCYVPKCPLKVCPPPSPYDLYCLWQADAHFMAMVRRSCLNIPEALLIHTLSKSYYPIHELFPTNLLSFQELVDFGTPYFPLPFLNPTTYLPSNLTSTNWISSPYLINFPFSFFLCQGFVIGSIGLSLTLHTNIKEQKKKYFTYPFCIKSRIVVERDDNNLVMHIEFPDHFCDCFAGFCSMLLFCHIEEDICWLYLSNSELVKPIIMMTVDHSEFS